MFESLVMAQQNGASVKMNLEMVSVQLTCTIKSKSYTTHSLKECQIFLSGKLKLITYLVF